MVSKQKYTKSFISIQKLYIIVLKIYHLNTLHGFFSFCYNKFHSKSFSFKPKYRKSLANNFLKMFQKIYLVIYLFKGTDDELN